MQKIQVLYIDDEPDFLEIVKFYLERSGQLFVETASSAETGMQIIKENPVQAIVSDYQMYGMDGITFLKRVRQDFGNIPFILFTGKGREEVVVQALNNGVDFYLQKGPDINAMIAELENMILQSVRRYDAERNLLIREERLNLALDASNDGIFDWEMSRGKMYWSPRYYRMLGYEPDEIEASFDSWVELLHPEDVARAREAVRAYLEMTSSVYDIEFRIRTKAGGYRWILARGKIVQRDQRGDPVRMTGTHADIHDRKMMENALKESEVRFHELFDTINSGVAIYEVKNDGAIGADYIVKDFNEASLKIEGLTKDQVVGKSLKDLRPKIDEYGLIPIFQRVWRSGRSEQYPAKVYSDGKYFSWYENRIFRLPLGEIVAIYDDVTDVKNKEEALRVSEERLYFALEGGNQGVWDRDLKSNQIFFSKRWKEMLGFSEDEIRNDYSEWWERVHPDDKNHVKERLQSHLAGLAPIYRNEHRLRCKDGSYKWILTIGRVTTRDENGDPLRMIGTHTDIDEMKQTELALRQANAKLNLLSSLTRHDLINKLMVVMGYTELLRKKPQDSDSEHYLDRMDKVLRSLNAEINFTKDYQDMGLKEPQWQDIAALLRQLDSPVPVTVDFSGISVYADPMLIKVFRNLLDNSMRHGEKVMNVRVHAYVTDGSLRILWEDDGVGVQLDQKERIFQWGVGRNMGLGLFLIRQVLSITDMTIRETGEPGKGARFEIDVPMESYRLSLESMNISI